MNREDLITIANLISFEMDRLADLGEANSPRYVELDALFDRVCAATGLTDDERVWLIHCPEA